MEGQICLNIYPANDAVESNNLDSEIMSEWERD